MTIDGTVVRRESLERHVSDETGEEKYIRVLPNDLVYNTMRLWQGAIGIVSEEGLVSPAYTVLRLRDTSDRAEYWWHLFRSPEILNAYRRFVKGIAKDRWRIYFKDLKNLRVRAPNHDVRGKVADELGALLDSEKLLIKRRQNLLALRGKVMEIGLRGSDV